MVGEEIKGRVLAPGVKRVEVKTYMVDPVCTVFTGYINIPPRRRLLDFLNGVPLGELHADEDFLPVSEARISSLDERGEVTARQL